MQKLIIKKCLICNREFNIRENGTNRRIGLKSVRSKQAKTCSKKCSKFYTRNRKLILKGVPIEIIQGLEYGKIQ